MGTLLLGFISIGSILIPLSLAILQWRRLPKDIALLRALLICTALCDIAMLMLGLVFSLPNLFVGNVYMFIQFGLLLYIFSRQFQSGKSLNAIFGTLVLLYGIGLISSRNQTDLTSIVNALSSLVLIVVSIMFFYKLLNELKFEKIHRQPIVWIAFATLFYYSGNLFIFLAFNYLIETGSLINMWSLHNILNITKNILFAVALWQNYRVVRSSV